MKWYERVAADPLGSRKRLAERRGLTVDQLDKHHQRVAEEQRDREDNELIPLREAVIEVINLAEAKWIRRIIKRHRLTPYQLKCICTVSQYIEHGRWPDGK